MRKQQICHIVFGVAWVGSNEQRNESEKFSGRKSNSGCLSLPYNNCRVFCFRRLSENVQFLSLSYLWALLSTADPSLHLTTTTMPYFKFNINKEREVPCLKLVRIDMTTSLFYEWSGTQKQAAVLCVWLISKGHPCKSYPFKLISDNQTENKHMKNKTRICIFWRHYVWELEAISCCCCFQLLPVSISILAAPVCVCIFFTFSSTDCSP